MKTSKGDRPLELFVIQLSASVCNKRKGIESWREKGLGIRMGDGKESCVSNLRFIDDVPLLANSLNQLKKTMSDFKRSAERQGLKIHPDETKIFSNQKSSEQ